jgi:hypothetical protein
MEADVVLAFVVVGAEGEISRIEVRERAVEDAREDAVSSAGADGYILAVTAHSLVRLQPEPQLKIEVGTKEDGAP